MMIFYSEKARRRLEGLATEYREKGYEVTLFPDPDEVPQALRGLEIPLIGYQEFAQGPSIVIADVRTRQTLTLDGSASLETIAKRAELLQAEVHLVVIGSDAEEEAS